MKKPLCFLLIFLPLILHAQKKPILQKRIDIKAKNETLFNVLIQIEEKGKVYFSYNSDILDEYKKISIDYRKKTIEFILTRILNDNSLKYKEIENQIVIYKPLLSRELKNIPKGKIILSGRVIDHETKEPVIAANISILEKSIGTITNADGEFIFKIPPDYKDEILAVSFLGYRTKIVPVSVALDTVYIFSLAPLTFNLDEIIVRGNKPDAISPTGLIQNALKNISQNYIRQNSVLTCFYRETVRDELHFYTLAEAVLDVFKNSYKQGVKSDRVRLIKVRENQFVDYKGIFRVFKIEGGPYYSLKNDLVKYPLNFLDYAYFNYYDYSINQVLSYNGRKTYVVNFTRNNMNPETDLNIAERPVYQGNIYIDAETYAFIKFDVEICPKELTHLSAQSYIKKNSLKAKAKLINSRIIAEYKLYKNKWCLNYTKGMLILHFEKEEKEIDSDLLFETELLVTEKQETIRKNFRKRESFSFNDILFEKVGDYDMEFWGDFNIIKPDESILNASRKSFPDN